MTNAIQTRPGQLLAPQLDYILVDGSGSMLDKWWDSMAALDSFVHTLREGNLNSHLITSVFCSGHLSMIQRDQKISDWKPFSDDPLVSHWSMTPLYDAINVMARHIRDLDPSAASIVVVTDGEDTGNDFTDVTQAHALIAWLKAKGYQVTFIGAEFNNSRQARLLGVSEESCIGVQQKLLSDAAKNLGMKRRRHYHTGEDMHFSGQEKQQFGGYLNAPGADNA